MALQGEVSDGIVEPYHVSVQAGVLDKSDTEDGGHHNSAQPSQEQQHDKAHVRASAPGQHPQPARQQRSASPVYSQQQQAGPQRHVQSATAEGRRHMDAATTAKHRHMGAVSVGHDKSTDKEDGSGFSEQLPPGAFSRRGNLTGNLTGLDADLDGDGVQAVPTASEGADAAAPPHKKLKLKLPRRPVSASSDAYDESWYTEHLDRQPELQGPIAHLAQVQPRPHHNLCHSSTAAALF